MNKLFLGRGQVNFPAIYRFGPANNLNRTVRIETLGLDIDLVASILWGDEQDSAKAIPLLDPATGDPIELPIPVALLNHGIMLKDFAAPYMFVKLTPGIGKTRGVSSLEQSGNITQLGAGVQFSVDPGGSDTNVSVEYGLTEAYGSHVDIEALLQGDGGIQPLLTTLANLRPGETYHWRVKMTNSVGVSYGHDQTFETLAIVAPIIAAIVPTPAANACHIALTVNPGGALTNVVLQYGLDNLYGQGVNMPDAPAGTEAAAISVDIANLLPATTYHFRFVATNSAGVEEGDDTTFLTLA
jgi:hypothetical protein